MKRESLSLYTMVIAGAKHGTSSIAPPLTSKAPHETTSISNRSKLYTSGTNMTEGTYQVSFSCQHRSNNAARHKYSHVEFLIDGEAVSFDNNPTRDWQHFGNLYILQLGEGDHAFELCNSAEGGEGASQIRKAEISVVLQNI